MPGIKIIFGAAGKIMSEETVPEVLKLLEENGIKTIDTARVYSNSEELLGKAGATKTFTVSTKHPGGAAPKSADKEGIVKVAEESFRLLQTEQVDIYYLHTPARDTPLESTLEGINELYKAGKFKRFGLSNFSASEVKEAIQIAKEKGFVLPTVYQGNYSAVSRKAEKELFPFLRENGMSFYAYSPMAGGFLAKTREQITTGVNAGRFSAGDMIASIYNTLYNKSCYLEALDKWGIISQKSGIAKPELAYRWVLHNSPLTNENGDGIIVGATSVEQLKETLGWLKNGPLPEDVVKQIDEVWEVVEHEADLDYFNRDQSKQT